MKVELGTDAFPAIFRPKRTISRRKAGRWLGNGWAILQ
jgi:hypothetical protein